MAGGVEDNVPFAIVRDKQVLNEDINQQSYLLKK